MNEITDETAKKSKQYIYLAEHILTHTYSVLKEPKFLMRCIEYLFLSMTNMMTHVLTIERQKRTIPPFQNTFQEKFYLFKTVAKNYKIEEKDIAFINELYLLITFHKKSAMEFTKNNELIVCSDEFETKKITEKTIIEFIDLTKKIAGKTL